MLLFSFEFPPVDGGISRLCGEIVKGLKEKDLPTEVLHETISRRRPLREFHAWTQLLRNKKKPILSGIWYPEGLLATLAGARPHVILAHGSELLPTRSRWRRALWQYLQRRVLEMADLVIANSRFTEELVRKTAPAAKVISIPLAVDHNRFTPGNKEEAKKNFEVAGRKVITTVARLVLYKGHETVFEAIAALPSSKRENLIYLIAGQGPDQCSLRKSVARLGIQEQVRWLNFVSEEELPALYRASDLFVMCTRQSELRQEVEGFGLAFLEAQACGTPVIGARTGGIPDAVENGRGGWLIEQDDVATLSAFLARLAAGDPIFQQASLQARARIEEACTWSRYLEKFIAALTQHGLNLPKTKGT